MISSRHRTTGRSRECWRLRGAGTFQRGRNNTKLPRRIQRWARAHISPRCSLHKQFLYSARSRESKRRRRLMISLLVCSSSLGFHNAGHSHMHHRKVRLPQPIEFQHNSPRLHMRLHRVPSYFCYTNMRNPLNWRRRLTYFRHDIPPPNMNGTLLHSRHLSYLGTLNRCKRQWAGSNRASGKKPSRRQTFDKSNRSSICPTKIYLY